MHKHHELEDWAAAPAANTDHPSPLDPEVERRELEALTVDQLRDRLAAIRRASAELVLEGCDPVETIDRLEENYSTERRIMLELHIRALLAIR